MPDRITVTVINGQAWALRRDQIAGLLRRAEPGSIIGDPAGAPPDPERLATVTDPESWADDPAALAEALAAGDDAAPPAGGRPPNQAGAVSTAGPERLTLTVEEAAALIGISRAFAYEAVRRGEIPSIRIGRRVLVPRTALERLLQLPSELEPGTE